MAEDIVLVPGGEAGRSLYDEVPPRYRELFDQLAAGSGDNTVTLPPEVFQHGFRGDAGPEIAAVVHSVLRPQPYRTFTDEPIDGTRYRDLDVPLGYVLSTEDIALPPGEYAWAPRFPERIGATPITVPGSHESIFTRPGALAERIQQAGAAG